MYNTNAFGRNTRVKEAAIDFCSVAEWKNPTAITLTMKKGQYFNHIYVALDEIMCSRNLRFCLNRLNQKLLGNARRKSRIKTVAVLERDRDGRFHYHLAIDRPSFVFEDEFYHELCRCWEKTIWKRKLVDERVSADDGWISYIMKLRSKAEYSESIDWPNCHL